jgi:prepilin-type N-terminal cleavage/methylation domain-containing protein
VNKKAFSLVEILISISLFSIIIIFLYQTLDVTERSNKLYTKELISKQDQNYLKKILFMDFINKKDGLANIDILVDNRKNSIVKIKTTHTCHNPFYQNITYLVSRKNNLIRLESKSKFDKTRLDDDFFDYCYVDIIQKDIEKFKVVRQNNKINLYILLKNKNKILMSY